MWTALSATAVAAQELPPAPRYTIHRASAPITLDGILAEADWASAEDIRLQWETLPGNNVPAPVETVCRMVYDTTTLYFGCEASDPDPSQIRAHLAERDDRTRTIQDDHIVFLLDPFNDERRGFEFRVNTLGVQMDAILARSEGIEDFSWNAVWDAEVQRHERGWTVEVAIPFGSLRFPQTDEIQTWGLVIDRSWPRSVRTRMRSAPTDRNTTCLLCGANKVTGFQGIEPGGSVELIPTATASRREERTPFPQGALEPVTESQLLGLDPDLGLDVRWGLTSALSLNATLNPDFSQVEADVAQLAENRRFALLFPETRTFFLEGADFFATPLRTVFTRSVVDPMGGVKLTGKEGPSAVGAFAALDDETSLLLPANAGSRSASIGERSQSSVYRLRRDAGASSNVGVLYTDREATEYRNRVYGADFFYRFTASNAVRAQYVRSSTEYPQTIVDDYGQPTGSFGGGALFAEYTHNSRDWVASARVTDLTEGFRADLGFIPRVDVRTADASVGRVFSGSSDGWYTRIETALLYSRTEDQAGVHTDGLVGGRVTYQGPNQSTFVVSPSRRRLLYDGVAHDLDRLEGSFEIRPAGSATFLAGYRIGDFVDFRNSRKSFGLALTPAAQLYLGPSIAVELQHTHQRLRWMGGAVYTANLTEARLLYHFGTRAFVRAILQYRRTDRNTSLFVNPVDARSEQLFGQFLFSYEVTPQTVLFVGYTEGQRGNEVIELVSQQRALFIKVGYAIHP